MQPTADPVADQSDQLRAARPIAEWNVLTAGLRLPAGNGGIQIFHRSD